MQLKSSITVLAAIAIVGAVSACAPATQQSGPDPEPVKLQNPKIIGAYRLPGGFRNVIVWCDGPNSNGVTSRGSDLAGGQNGGGLASAGWLIKLNDERCQS